MMMLKVTEEWRCDSKNEAESFIKAQREKGSEDNYEVLKAGYVHKDKKSKGEIIDSCEVVTIVKEYATVWMI